VRGGYCRRKEVFRNGLARKRQTQRKWAAQISPGQADVGAGAGKPTNIRRYIGGCGRWGLLGTHVRSWSYSGSGMMARRWCRSGECVDRTFFLQAFVLSRLVLSCLVLSPPDFRSASTMASDSAGHLIEWCDRAQDHSCQAGGQASEARARGGSILGARCNAMRCVMGCEKREEREKTVRY
jgi:hypothetical protein